MMKSVSIIQQYIAPYRWSFHEMLAEKLAKKGIDYRLLSGSASRGDDKLPDFASYAPAHFFGRAFWQNVLQRTAADDLVIITQAVRNLPLYPLVWRNIRRKQRVALWGHGKNFQARNPDSLEEKLKKVITRKVHWFFAYNNLSASMVKDLGYPTERITTMMNAIDTSGLAAAKARQTPAALQKLRESLGIETENVGIYTGAMYPDKRMPFLLEACTQIRRLVPDFEMIFIGGGKDQPLVEAAARANPWIHYVGYKQNEEKAPYWALAKLFLMPGAVGLVILDSFALEVPMITTAVKTHGPEIDYLHDGENGVMLDNPDSVEDFAVAAAQLLQDESIRQKLVAGCRASAPLYTVENSVTLYADGIQRALAAPFL
jgi:glycosyltransferase involved in cell wall biosynthesis